MKNVNCFPLLLSFLFVAFSSCKKEEVPTLTTSAITNITGTSATSGGNITYDGGAAVSVRGVCWSTDINPSIQGNKTSDGSGEGSYVSNIINLDRGTTYYVRAYATNSAGTGYGEEVSFTTPELITFNSSLTYGTASDIDGNTYKTIQIGTQTWFAENLKTTKYSDNTLIPYVADGPTWGNLETPAYCWYNNDENTYKATYGGLYNWYAVNTGKLCPEGWQVPSQQEVTILRDFLGGREIAGGKLMETGIAHWESLNTGVSNSSGFTALPAYERRYNGGFWFTLTGTAFWTSTINLDYEPPVAAFVLSIDADWTSVGFSNFKFGFSIRCLKD